MERFFRKWTRATLVAIYLVIVAGSVVRMSGSGMGCPDWPKCFGYWIPPTHASQLPANYKEIYKERYGYENTVFNVYHTWTEAINRYIGFIAGDMTVILLLLAFVLWVRKKGHFLHVFLAFLLCALMGFQAWLGAQVVYSELDPGSITLHMMVALVIVALVICILHRVHPAKGENSMQYRPVFFWMLIAGLAILSLQIYFGTEVRGEIDVIAKKTAHTGRGSWLEQLSFRYLIHRSFSWAVLLIYGALIWFNYKHRLGMSAVYGSGVMVLILLLAGIGMAWFDVPAALQPVHLITATLLFGWQFWAILRYASAKRQQHTKKVLPEA